MNAQTQYKWFEDQVKKAIPEADTHLIFSYEPTVTPEVYLGRISLVSAPQKPLIKTDVRPEGLRLHFPVAWSDALSTWLGTPPNEVYRLKSNWVHQPSIGLAVANFEPHFAQLTIKIIELLKQTLAA